MASLAAAVPRLLPVRAERAAVTIAGKSILRNIDLEIAKNTRTLILGSNGAGKSTLLRLLHGLLPPTAGRVVSASGEPVSDRALRQHDAMLFQRPVMLRTTALNNVIYAAQHASPDVSTNALNIRAAAALQSVGLAELANRPARVLSGGEQQRVAFARALVRNPEVLFLDEPTASLDPQSARQIESLIVSAAERGVTIVMTTHNLAQAKRLATQIVFLNDGEIAEVTPAAQFFDQPQSATGCAFLEGESL
jgi:tungstate transport system ATP-binding protein